jgi:hypothetical protein
VSTITADPPQDTSATATDLSTTATMLEMEEPTIEEEIKNRMIWTQRGMEGIVMLKALNWKNM